MDSQNQSFRVGAVVSKTFAIWIKHFFLVTALTGLAYVPWTVYAFSNPDVATGLAATGGDISWIPIVLSMVGWLLGSLTVVHLVVTACQGRKPSAGRSLAVGIKRLLPVIGALILLGLLGFVAMFAVGLLSLPLSLVHPALAAVVIYPIFIWMFMSFFVLVPVLVAEPVGVTQAFGRSIDLMQGAKLKCFLMILLLGIVNFGFQFVAVYLAMSIDTLIVVAVQTVLGIAMASLWSVLCAVSYTEVREVNEGVSVDELAQVFE